MQIELFLHKFLTTMKRFPKHKYIFMRTDLFSLEPKNDRKAHRIELCRNFSQNFYDNNSLRFFVKNECFGIKMWEQFPYCILAGFVI